MTRRKMFSKIISSVEFSLCPVQVKLYLLDLIFDSVILHIEGLVALHTDLRSDYISGRGIVSL